MSVVFLLLIIVISFVAVRVGSVALELTGIDPERARFQALSAFTNSGYTTRESEDMVKHPLRRRIISALMIVGNAGMVTTIGTFASTVLEGNVTRTLLNVGIIIVGLIALLAVARWQGLTQRMHDAAQKWLAARYDFHAPTTEDLLRVGQGYGLSRVHLEPGAPVIGRQLRELDLKSRMVQILAIERRGRYIAIPVGEDRLEEGDYLIVYGTEMAVARTFTRDSTNPVRVGKVIGEDA